MTLLRGRYRLTDKLAEHDAVATWRGVDEETKRPVAVKILDVSRAASAQDVELFTRQARVLKTLRHDRIPSIVDAFEVHENGAVQQVLVQTFVEGASLDSDLPAMRERDIIGVGIQVAQVLEYLHSVVPPVVHRDVKPANVVLDTDGRAHLVDFGSVAAPRSGGTVVGTYGYMPLEQYEGRASPASDVYGLGVTLIYLAARRHPWELDGSPFEAVTQLAGISPEFRAVLRKLVEPDARRRIADGRAAREALELIGTPRRSWVPVAAGLLGALLLGGGGVVAAQWWPSDIKPVVVVTAPLPAPPAPPRPTGVFPSGLGAAHRCFERTVPRIVQSRFRYASWVDWTKGPTCDERYVTYGLYEAYDDAIEQCANAVASAPPSLRLGQLAGLAREGIPLLKRASRYYDEKRYVDDRCQEGRALHPKLVALFDGIMTYAREVEGAYFAADIEVFGEMRREAGGVENAAGAIAAHLLEMAKIIQGTPQWGPAHYDAVALRLSMRAIVDRWDGVAALPHDPSWTHASDRWQQRTERLNENWRRLVGDLVDARPLREGYDPLQLRRPFHETIVHFHVFGGR